MPRYFPYPFLALALLLALAACDRSDLTEDDPPIPPDPDPPAQVSTCSAQIDGDPFTASAASASAMGDGTTLDIQCDALGERLLFQVRPAGFGPATIRLGESGNRAQYTVGSDAVVTIGLPGGEDPGEIVLTQYTSDRVGGTFLVNLPGFQEDDPIVRVSEGLFNIDVRLAVP